MRREQQAAQEERRQVQPGVAEARRGAEPGLAPHASGRKERLGASGLTRTLFMRMRKSPWRRGVSAAAPQSLRRGAGLCRVHVGEQMMA